MNLNSTFVVLHPDQTSVRTTMLFVTPGAGTEHKPLG
jgi:hypothetical protein